MKKGIHEGEIAQLKAENHALKQVLKAAPGHIYWKDLSGVYLGCNEEQAKAAGMTVGEYIGKTDFELPWKNDANRIREIDNSLLNATGPIVTEEIIHPGGKQKVYMSTKQAMVDDENNITGIIGVSVDITPQKQIAKLENELAKTKERLRVSQLMAASIAHEVRTPLSGIGMQLEIFKDQLPSGQSILKKVYEKITDSLKATQTIIEMLLLKSRVTKLEIEDQCSSSAVESIQSAIEDYPFKPKQKDLMDLSVDSDFKYMGNAFYFKHIIFNLLKNAFYAIQKAQKGRIKIVVDGKYRKILFEDTGCGISESILPHIFEFFYTQSNRGTGVGLALSRQIMREFGGDLKCETKLGEFTRFSLVFPKIEELK